MSHVRNEADARGVHDSSGEKVVLPGAPTPLERPVPYAATRILLRRPPPDGDEEDGQGSTRSNRERNNDSSR